jgi:hypothetical protein
MPDVKQKFSLWLPLEAARRFDVILRRVKKDNRGRAEFGEIMRELMGFPLEEGEEPLLTAEDRLIISQGIKGPIAVQGSKRNT